MNTVQDQILSWIAREPASIGLLVFCVGLLFGFEGWRFYRVLLAGIMTFTGYVSGTIAGMTLKMEPILIATAGAGIGLLLGWKSKRASETIGTAAVLGAYGWYLAEQCHFPGTWPLACGAITAGIGAMLANVAKYSIPLVVTALIGGFLMMVGAIGITATYIPTFSSTFRYWAHSWPLVGPIMMAMAVAMSYAYASNHRQGSMISGA